MTGAFRQYLFPRDHPRLADIRGMDAYRYAEHARTPGTFTGNLIAGWQPLYGNDFRGISPDGVVRPELFPLTPAEPDERAPVEEMLTAARRLLDVVTDDDRTRLCHGVDAVEWQTWANPEFLQFDTGLRLEFRPAEVRAAVLDLMRVSLGPDGFAIVDAMMRINGFLGEVVDLPTILNRFSYNVALYGEPDPVEPWGWQVFGHHCAVNCLVVDGRMALGPVFLGAEPDAIDEGPGAGIHWFTGHVDAARAVMAGLDAEQRSAAVLYDAMVDPAMPPGRIHPGDERHLAGAFRDNRVIPEEGSCARTWSPAARAALTALVEEFAVVLPSGPRRARMREITAHLDDTWFCWIGGRGDSDVFYCRVQSPVVIAEIDHHCGVFLDYDTPKPFHVHTVLRTPNGNDYGRAWVRQWGRR